MIIMKTFMRVMLMVFVVSGMSGVVSAMEDMPAMPHHPAMMPAGSLLAKVGEPAPGFMLDAVVSTEKDKEFRKISLTDYRGKWLVLFFYPADFTMVCPTEIKGFNEALAKFNEIGAEVVGASTDSKWSHLAWIKRGDLGALKYPLLADFNKETARRYGILEEKRGVALRGLFIIDPKGVLQYQVVHNTDVGRSVEETLRVLEALQTGSLCPLGWKPGQKTITPGK